MNQINHPVQLSIFMNSSIQDLIQIAVLQLSLYKNCLLTNGSYIFKIPNDQLAGARNINHLPPRGTDVQVYMNSTLHNIVTFVVKVAMW